jgi:hypothetical protein
VPLLNPIAPEFGLRRGLNTSAGRTANPLLEELAQQAAGPTNPFDQFSSAQEVEGGTFVQPRQGMNILGAFRGVTLQPGTGVSRLRASELDPQQRRLASSVALRQFFDPSLSAQQNVALEAIRKNRVARGLRGKAAEGAVAQAARKFVSGNRAASLDFMRQEFELRRNQALESLTSRATDPNAGVVDLGGGVKKTRSIQQLEGLLGNFEDFTANTLAINILRGAGGPIGELFKQESSTGAALGEAGGFATVGIDVSGERPTLLNRLDEIVGGVGGKSFEELRQARREPVKSDDLLRQVVGEGQALTGARELVQASALGTTVGFGEREQARQEGDSELGFFDRFRQAVSDVVFGGEDRPTTLTQALENRLSQEQLDFIESNLPGGGQFTFDELATQAGAAVEQQRANQPGFTDPTFAGFRALFPSFESFNLLGPETRFGGGTGDVTLAGANPAEAVLSEQARLERQLQGITSGAFEVDDRASETQRIQNRLNFLQSQTSQFDVLRAELFSPILF